VRFAFACAVFALALGSVVAALVYGGMVGAGPTMLRAFEAWGLALVASAVAWRLAAALPAAWLRRGSAGLFFLLAGLTAYWVGMVLITRPPFG
jgi:hypothetical protein